MHDIIIGIVVKDIFVGNAAAVAALEGKQIRDIDVRRIQRGCSNTAPFSAPWMGAKRSV